MKSVMRKGPMPKGELKVRSTYGVGASLGRHWEPGGRGRIVLIVSHIKTKEQMEEAFDWLGTALTTITEICCRRQPSKHGGSA